MSLKFNCDNCGRNVVVKYLNKGEKAKCKSCGAEMIVPIDAIETDEKPWYDATEKYVSGKCGTGVSIGDKMCPKSDRALKNVKSGGWILIGLGLFITFFGLLCNSVLIFFIGLPILGLGVGAKIGCSICLYIGTAIWGLLLICSLYFFFLISGGGKDFIPIVGLIFVVPQLLFLLHLIKLIVKYNKSRKEKK